MKPAASTGRPADGYVDALLASGRYTFTTEEATRAFGTSEVAARAALRRLAARSRIAMPLRGFHVIVPPEYRKLGCLPPEQFVPQLMEVLGLHYYAALLTAAQYHGSAHQRPQRFQVAVATNRKRITCGLVEVEFVARKEVARVPVKSLSTPRGPLRVSSVEATLLDVVGYVDHVGGLDQAAAVVGDLGGQVDGAALVEVAGTAPVSWSQRLGYLLDLFGHAARANALASFVRENAGDVVPLAPSEPAKRTSRVSRWRLDANVEVDAEP